MRKSHFSLATVIGLFAAVVPVVGVPPATAAPGDVLISEVRVDQPSGDIDEYVELSGTPAASLDGYAYIVIGDGSVSAGSGVIETVVALDGLTFGSDGLLLVAESTATLGTPDLTANLNFENSDNVTHMVVRGFSGANGDDLDSDDDGVLDTDPWAEITDSVALVESTTSTGTEWFYATTMVGPDGSSAPGHVFRCDDAFVIGAFDPVGGADTPGAANPCRIEVSVSEIRIDQPGGDDDEYVELAGDPGVGLGGLSYIVLGDSSGGGSGVIESVTDLGGSVIPPSGLLVIAEATFGLGTADVVTSLNFENSDNVTHLIVQGFTGASGDDLDIDDDGTLDTVPWSAVVDSVALVESLSGGESIYSATTVGPEGSFVPGHAYRCDDGFRIGMFDFGDPTDPDSTSDDSPGAPNPCAPDGEPVDPFGVCGDPATLVHEAQGSALSSPLEGQDVIIEGVVVADFQDEGIDRFHVQEQDGDSDGDPATSEAIAVADAGVTVDVNVGDVVRVSGTVTETFQLTELSPVTRVDICSPGAGGATPTPLGLPNASVADLEPFENMLVTLPQSLTVTDTFELSTFGEVVLSADGRQFSPTHLAAPSAGVDSDLDGDGVADVVEPGRIILDDLADTELTYGSVDLPPYVDASGTRRIGDTVTGLTGVLDYAFDEYRIRPTGAVAFVAGNPRPAAPDLGGNLTVASFNVLNFFATVDDGTPTCGPADTDGCRGADSVAELDRQRAKITAAISELDADVVGLTEIDNDDSESLDALATGLTGYDSVSTGSIGDDAVKVGFLYKPAAVTPVGEAAILDSSVDSSFDDTKNRPALAQTFRHNDTGDVVTVVITHLKSKGSACDDVGDSDANDGQGNCNGVRTAAASAMATWLAGDPTGAGDGDVLIVGDLNAHANEDPVTSLEGDGYSDLLEEFVAAGERYSYVFRGMSGYLDHGLANAALLPKVAGAALWHINADEPRFTDYNDDTLDAGENEFTSEGDLNPPAAYQAGPFRASDHDPVVIGLAMEAPPEPEVAPADGIRPQLAALSAEIAGEAEGDRRARSAHRWLELSLADKYWVDDDTLGRSAFSVFRAHSYAARTLGRSGVDDAVVEQWIDEILDLDRQLVVAAIDNAAPGRHSHRRIAAAEWALGIADRLDSRGKDMHALIWVGIAWRWVSRL